MLSERAKVSCVVLVGNRTIAEQREYQVLRIRPRASSSGAADTHRATNTPCCSVLSRGRVPPVSEFRSGARYAHVSETFGIVLRTTTQPGLRSNCGAVSEIYFDQASITRGLVPRCYKARYSTAGVLGALLIKVSHSNTPERRVAW